MKKLALATVLATVGLAGCCCQWTDVYTEGSFPGTFTGHVELLDGTALGLTVETVLGEKAVDGYTFYGQAQLAGDLFRIEGEERSQDERVHYQAVPPPSGHIAATLLDATGTPRYQLFFYLAFVDGWRSDALEGSLLEGETFVGDVYLRSRPYSRDGL